LKATARRRGDPRWKRLEGIEMEMSGEYRIAAPRQVVWDSLNDRRVLKSCLGGCERLDKLSDRAFDAVVTAKVGPVKATFTGAVELSDVDPPNAYVISGEGKGGAAGFAKGSATVRLRDDDGVTVLGYTVDARLGGKLGQMGARVVDPIARRMADDFFGKFAEAVGGGSMAEPEVPQDAVVPEGKPSGGLVWFLVIMGAGALALLGATLLGGGN
jgi:carbon monoxide dehydrogenase subunit G